MAGPQADQLPREALHHDGVPPEYWPRSVRGVDTEQAYSHPSRGLRSLQDMTASRESVCSAEDQEYSDLGRLVEWRD
jgi:hypothetical protein